MLYNTTMKIRILSFNIHKGIGWTRHKPTLAQIHEQIRLLHPDIVFLQETRGSQFEFLAGEIWPHFSYGKNAVYAKGHHGNAILSKFPITFSQNIEISMGAYERRGLLHSIVHPPVLNHPVHLICVHLGLLRKDRCRQLEEIVNYVESTIPKNAALIMGGDFNDWRDHATEPLIEGLGLQEAFLDQHGTYAKTFPAWAPILKLDRIYSRGFHTNDAERLTQQSWKSLSDHIALNVCLQPQAI